MGKIDARGRSCPQPVMMTKVHVEKGETEIEVFLDNAVSASNVQRYLEKNGYSVRIFDEEGSIIIRASVRSEVSLSTDVPPSPSADSSVSAASDIPRAPQSAPTADFRPAETAAVPARCAVLITRKGIGGDDALLGEVLMKGFLGTISQMSPLPSVIALMNEGVHLAMKHTASLDHLSLLEKKGVRILVCGTCTNHFGITSDIGAGVISNMFEITESLLAAGKTLSL